jgi:hypothetical protein
MYEPLVFFVIFESFWVEGFLGDTFLLRATCSVVLLVSTVVLACRGRSHVQCKKGS